MSSSPTLGQLRDLMPFAAAIGIELIEASPELVRGRLNYAASLCTVGGLIHGGALMALADSCGGVCAYLNLPDGALGTATIESKTNFLRGIREGEIAAITRPLYLGRSTLVLETELLRADRQLAAKVTQTQAFLYPRS